jgi:uncharacterized protein YkwD
LITNVLLCAMALVLTDPAATKEGSTPKNDKKVQATERQEGKQSQPADALKKKSDEARKSRPAPTPKDPDETEVDGVKLITIEANVVAYTNQQRAQYGLPPLVVDKDLMETAREHCCWMTRFRLMRHTQRMVAENIAMGQPHSSEAVRCWMNSSGHRANILNPNHRRIGVAAYRTEDGTIFWCQQFEP